MLEKYHSMEQPILSSAQLSSSNLDSSHTSGNYLTPDNNQELKVNKKGLSGDKMDVKSFISLTTHLRSIYFYFTQSNTFLYPISMSKRIE